MAFHALPTLNLKFSGNEKDVIVSIPNAKAVPNPTDINAAATTLDGKFAKDNTAEYEFGYYSTDSIVANAE